MPQGAGEAGYQRVRLGRRIERADQAHHVRGERDAGLADGVDGQGAGGGDRDQMDEDGAADHGTRIAVAARAVSRRASAAASCRNVSRT